LLWAYPLEIAKTRLNLEFGKGDEFKKYHKTFQTIYEIISKENFAGLYKGLLLTSLTILP